MTYKNYLEAGKLNSRIRNKDAVELIPSDKDLFSSQGMLIKFSRDNEKVNGFVLDAGRVKNLNFVKRNKD